MMKQELTELDRTTILIHILPQVRSLDAFITSKNFDPLAFVKPTTDLQLL